MNNLTQSDIAVLRSLAERYAEIASLPEQKERIDRWKKFNTLQGGRPMALIDQLPWNELNQNGILDLKVSDPYWRGQENWLRQEIYKWEHMRADMAIDPYVKLSRPIQNTGWGLSPKVTRLFSHDTTDIAAQAMESVISSMEDVEKIQIPKITLDEEAQKEIAQTADYLFGGIIGWKFTGIIMHLGAWDTIAYWMNVENCYIELMDRPEMMHAIMEKMTQGYLAQIEQASALKLFDTTGHYCHCSQTYRPDDTDADEGTSRDAWAFGLAQLFTSVSPKITDEFECAYMKRIFPHFKHIYYGCCDRLDDRMEYVSALPNVRKMSCSPWSHREEFAEKLPKTIIMSNKPTPALLAGDGFDEDAVRSDLRRTIEAAKRYGKSLEMILKDISTVRYHPERIWRWSEIAAEECEKG